MSHTLPATVIAEQDVEVDTPRRRRASPQHARLAYLRIASARYRRREPGRTRGLGARIVGLSAIAAALRPLRPDCRPYSTKTAERVVADLVEFDGLVEVVPAPHVWDSRRGRWTRPHPNAYRIIGPVDNRKTAGRADTTWMSGRSPNGEPELADDGSRSRLVECNGCGAPFARGKEPPDRLCGSCRDG